MVYASELPETLLLRQIDHAESVLSTPGVTGLEWDRFAPGQDPVEHLAYLQRIAHREQFSLGLPPVVMREVRACWRRWARRPVA